MPAFGIPAGFSVFVPFGHLAIIVAVSPDDDNVIGSYITVPILENTFMMKTFEQVWTEVQGYLIKSMGRKLKLFRDAETKGAFEVWINSWPSWRTLDSSEKSPELTSQKFKDSLHTAIDFATENPQS